MGRVRVQGDVRPGIGHRLSTIWGYSNPPDTFVPLADLADDYKAYQEWTNNPDRDGKYVFVMPTP
jgi:hypothetical protein